MGLDIRRTHLTKTVFVEGFFDSQQLSAAKARNAGACLVMLVAGEELYDFARNALGSLKRAGLQQPIYVYTTRSSLPMVHRLATSFSIRVECLDDISEHDLSGYQQFGTSNFNFLTNLKWTALLDAFSRGHNLVTFADCDIAFLRNFESFVDSAKNFYACGLQSEARNVFPPQFCTGFMYFREDAIPLLEFLRDLASANSFIDNDQVLFNETVAAHPELVRQIHLLPEAVFMNGMQFAGISGSRHPVQVHEVEPVLFHANYASGLEAKQALLESSGLWNLESESQ